MSAARGVVAVAALAVAQLAAGMSGRPSPALPVTATAAVRVDDLQTPLAFCPLPMSQQEEAAAAFRVLAPTFHHARCANCHGAIRPFDRNGGHFGGALRRKRSAAENIALCQECHGGLPGWDQPVAGMSFHDKSPDELCLQMKRTKPSARAFLEHLFNDGGEANVQFGAEAFRGTRGLSEGARIIYEDETGRPFTPEPPPISHAMFMNQAEAWVDAMGGEFVGSAECGCIPLQLELFLDSRIIATDDADLFSTHVRATIPLDADAGGGEWGRAPLEHLDNQLGQLPGCIVQGEGEGGFIRVLDLEVTTDGGANLALAGRSPPTITLTLVPENSGGSIQISCPGILSMTIPNLQWSQQWRFLHEADRREDRYQLSDWRIERSSRMRDGRTVLATKEIRTRNSWFGIDLREETRLELRAVRSDARRE